MGRQLLVLRMGNTQARRRLNAKDFQYIANNTALLNMQIVTEYFTELNQKYPDGKMEAEDFKKIFHLAFPERKQDKVDQLAEKLRNLRRQTEQFPCSPLPCCCSGSLTVLWMRIWLRCSNYLMKMVTAISASRSCSV